MARSTTRMARHGDASLHASLLEASPETGARSARPRLGWLLCATLAVGAPLASQAAVHATLDRSVAAPDEVVTLVLTSDTAAGGVQPDLAPLRQDFDLLGTSTGRQTTIVNGQRSEQSRWDVELRPKHAGRVEIPSIALGAEHTQVLTLDVAQPSPEQQAADAQHAFVEVETGTTTSPYVQQPIPYTVRLFYDDTVTPTQLDAPAPADATVDQLGPDKRYSADRHGRSYNVIERDYAITPEKSGASTIPAPGFRGTEAITGSSPSEPDPQQDMLSRMLANSPFRHMPDLADFRAAFGPGSPFDGASRPIAGQGRAIALTVRPRPAGLRGDWLPAEQVSISDSWASAAPVFKVGEPVTRVITLQAKGLAASQLPALTVSAPNNTNVYPESPVAESRTDGQAIYGSSRQNVTYIPTQAGATDVPPIDVAWWDVRGNVERHATLPAFHLQVASGAVAGTSAAPAPVVPATATGAVQRSPSDAPAKSSGPPWQPVAWALGAALALAGVALFLRRPRNVAPGPADVEQSPHLRKPDLMRALNEACVAGRAPEAARALLDLARLEWPSDPPRCLGALAARLEQGQDEVRELDRALYGAASGPWVGEALRHSMTRGLQAPRPAAGCAPKGLAPLYPAGNSR